MEIEQEIPFTNEALDIYILEANKRIEQLRPFVSEYNKLKNRVRVAKERIAKHNQDKTKAS